jgi:aconitate hydratase
MPEEFAVDDRMFIFPSDELRETEIVRGPNIGAPPRNDAMPKGLTAEVMIRLGDKITTDHIMPAGARLKYRSNVPRYATFVFENVDETFARRCLTAKEAGRHSIIVAGESYGQGSSREHAALCPMYLGVKAVIARSFERIHAANLVNFGILPVTFVNPSDYDRVHQGDILEFPHLHDEVATGKPVTVVRKTTGESLVCNTALSSRQRRIVLAGGLLNDT